MSGFMPWDSAVDLIKTGINKIWPDKTEADKARAALDQAQLAGSLKDLEAQWTNAQSQIAVNIEEAKSTNIFVAGWRPFIGWVCGVAFAWTFVFQPLITFFVKVSGSAFDPKTLPALDYSQMSAVLYGMLGLGTLRTVEKFKGVDQKNRQ